MCKNGADATTKEECGACFAVREPLESQEIDAVGGIMQGLGHSSARAYCPKSLPAHGGLLVRV